MAIPVNFDLIPYGTFVNKPPIWAKVQNNPFFLSSSGSYTSRFVLTPFGRGGFNIENPRATLDVKSLGGYNQPVAIFGRQRPGTTNKTQHVHFVPLLYSQGYNNISQTGDQGMFFTDGAGPMGSNLDGSFVIAPWNDLGGNGGLRMDANGNIELRGNLRATGIKVEARWWPDAVFAPSYKLMNWKDLESYINKNKHLPDVPSENEVLVNGIDLAETNAILLKKVEELTLYMIDLQKKNEQLQSRVSQLEKSTTR